MTERAAVGEPGRPSRELFARDHGIERPLDDMVRTCLHRSAYLRTPGGNTRIPWSWCTLATSQLTLLHRPNFDVTRTASIGHAEPRSDRRLDWIETKEPARQSRTQNGTDDHGSGNERIGVEKYF